MLSKRKLSYLLIYPYYIVLSVVLQHQSFAQEPTSYIAKEGQEIGKLNINNFSPFTYKGGPWVKGLTQDEQGLIYFASLNEPIVHTFDGTHFKKIKILNFDSRITSILAAKDTMWLGSTDGKRELGFITKDELGQYNGNNYFSIRALLSDTIRDKGVYSIKQLNNATYFLLQGIGLVRWRSGDIKTWSIPRVYRQMFTYKDKLYIPSNKLYTLENDSISVLSHWESGFLRALEPFDDQSALAVSTGKPQFSLFDGQKFTPVFQQLPRIKNIWSAMKIDDNYFLIGTLSEGLLIINKKGELVTRINKENGLQSNTTLFMIKAVDHTIWVATYNGLSQFKFPNPISTFGGNNTLSDNAKGIVRYKDHLFIGNKTGVYKLEKAQGYNLGAKFQPVKGADWWVRSMFNAKNGILIGTNGFGLYFFKDEVLTKINCPREYRILDIHQMRKVPNLYLMKAMGSLHLMEYKHNAFNHLGKIMDMLGNTQLRKTVLETFSSQAIKMYENYNFKIYIKHPMGLTKLYCKCILI